MRLGGIGRYAAVVTAVGLLALGQAWGAQAGKSPVKVFILAEQSNMEGQGVAYLEGKDYNQGRGTLNFLTAESRQRAPLQAPAWLVPIVCYDCRYARDVGHYALHAAASARLLQGYGLDWDRQRRAASLKDKPTGHADTMQ
jgi:hypothetical protein